MNIPITYARQLKQKPTDETKLNFGTQFTDHMFIMEYDVPKGWYAQRIEPYHSLNLDPATMVLHYAQATFEGLKAYHTPDGGISLFRPRDNFKRMNISDARLSIPAMDVDVIMSGLKTLLTVEKDWVPKSTGTSLYIRPTVIATDAHIGVRASYTYLFFIILSPVGAYYPEGLKPVSIYVENEYVRAVRGGMGFTKAGGNYAVSILAGEEAKKKGYSQVLWLDGVERRYIEEVGAMNMFFKIDGKLITPALSGSILPGITRDSVIRLAQNMNIDVEERRISIDEIAAAYNSGKLEEAFGTGTAAVISPVGKLQYGDLEMVLSNGEIGTLSAKLYSTLTDIQYCRIPDPFGWIERV